MTGSAHNDGICLIGGDIMDTKRYPTLDDRIRDAEDRLPPGGGSTTPPPDDDGPDPSPTLGKKKPHDPER